MQWAACLALVGAALTSVGAAADCAPPCGPIPVVIEIKIDAPKVLAFQNADKLVLKGTVSFYVNVDNDGFWFDPQNPPKMTFRVNRQPPWVKSSVAPDHFDVPVSDPRYVSQEGAPGQVQFYWEAPIEIAIQKLRDPTPDELLRSSGFVRPDGTYRILITSSTTSSVLAPEVFGPNMGLQEGYGIRELKFTPQINGVAWLLNPKGVLQPGGAPLSEPKGTAPAPMAAWVTLLLLGLAGWRRRRLG